MRVAAVPTSLLEWIAARFDLVPRPAVETFFGMLHSRVVMAGVRLGVFEALRDGPLTFATIAERRHLTPEGTRLLGNALVAGRYLRHVGQDSFELTAMSRRYLDARSPQYVGRYVEYNYDQWEWVEQLEQVVRSGKSLDIHDRLGAVRGEHAIGDWQCYLGGLADLARGAASEIARAVPLPVRTGARSRMLLDVGGGDGTFSVALCARYPDLFAEIIDLAGGVEAGRALVSATAPEGVQSRIRFRAADVLRDAMGAPEAYDAVLISQLLHHLPPDQVPAVLQRAVQVLRPGGWLTVIDLLEPARGHRPDATTAYASLYFHLTSRGRGYTASEIREWLRAAGCRKVRQHRLLRVPGQPMISGLR